MVPISINCLRSLSSFLNTATVVKTVAIQPSMDSNPSKVKAEMANVIIRKIHITLWEVVYMLVAKRTAASSPKNDAVQCSNNMKWPDIKSAETTRQATIFVLSLNWKEIISEQMATPIRICDKTKLDSNSIPTIKG